MVLLTTGILTPRPALIEDHPHASAVHGGMLVPVGDDRDHYHVEAVVTRGGIFRLYTFSADAAKVVEVKVQTLTAQFRAAGASGPVLVKLRANPQAGDSAGKTSQFVGRLPWALRGKMLEVKVPELIFGDHRFPVEFELAAKKIAGDMPTHRDDEDRLLRTSGGKYTVEDVQANGNTTAVQKFEKVKPRHDERPGPGDLVCPVTRAKASPKVAWTVGGKRYHFCCPPCVGEFVTLAKELPEEIEEPGAYVEKQ
ncbi:MAG: hypothetical protein K2R98_15175 [Gemmataceae bacterium]|nr:hypothetical protein [Gemmataceae bacterium]